MFGRANPGVGFSQEGLAFLCVYVGDNHRARTGNFVQRAINYSDHTAKETAKQQHIFAVNII
jgi:hypothetical protein